MSWRWGTVVPLVAVVVCDHHAGGRLRSAFYDADTATSRTCPVCGAMIFQPPHPDQSQPVEVRGL